MRGPVGFDLHSACLSCRVVAEAAPRPLVRLGDEPARHRVAMHVVELLDALGLGVNIEVIVAALPEGPRAALHRNRELERLQHLRQQYRARLAHQQMHVLGHDDVTGNEDLVPDAHRLQGALKEVSRSGCAEVGKPVEAGEGDEVEVAGPLNPDEAFWHGEMVHLKLRRSCDVPPTSQKRDVGHPAYRQ